jgi:AcrR family transcriptional regulator
MRPPRARRRRKDARPGEIIEAGLLEFAERGFEAARLDDVARRAGIAKGTIYRYFANKDALFEAALKARIAPVFERLAPLGAGGAPEPPGPVQAQIALFLRTVYRLLVESDFRVLLRIIVADGGRFPEIRDLYYSTVIEKGRAMLGQFVARGVAKGEFRAGALADFPIVLMGPVLMAAIWKMTFDARDPIPVERFFEAHLDLVLNGLLKR